MAVLETLLVQSRIKRAEPVRVAPTVVGDDGERNLLYGTCRPRCHWLVVERQHVPGGGIEATSEHAARGEDGGGARSTPRYSSTWVARVVDWAWGERHHNQKFKS